MLICLHNPLYLLICAKKADITEVAETERTIMVEVNTRIFGKIGIEDEKIIRFEKGILGFPDLRDFTLLYNVEKGDSASIKWLQSLQEPAFAMPVLNPDLVKPGYEPVFPEDLLLPLGELKDDNILMLVTVTVPSDVTKTTVNLRAPIIINTDNMKAIQLICDDESLSIKHAIYDEMMANQH